VMEQFGGEWRAEWLRLRSLEKWADYLRSLETHANEEQVCASLRSPS